MGALSLYSQGGPRGMDSGARNLRSMAFAYHYMCARTAESWAKLLITKRDVGMFGEGYWFLGYLRVF